ncbi:hypothetical protein [Streptomyces syringium]|uniref:hypothetical protein n=1 Tax=Streptomyces syringium TaxID=76729 RepID=UPI0033E3C892
MSKIDSYRHTPVERSAYCTGSVAVAQSLARRGALFIVTRVMWPRPGMTRLGGRR